MKFWDSSAVVPLIVREPKSAAALETLQRDPEIAVWWGTSIECASALARLERDGMPLPAVTAAFARLDELAASWIEIEPHEDIRLAARRLLRVHPLRAADALQLGAAWLLADGRPPAMTVLTLDDRVRQAALKEGFPAPEI